jgi:hypothetical protein
MELDAPVARLTMPDVPSPHNPVLLNHVVPSVERIRAKIDDWWASDHADASTLTSRSSRPSRRRAPPPPSAPGSSRLVTMVEEGEPLVELETDKVAMEVAAPSSGRLAAILIDTGDVQPGALLGHIAPGECQPAAAPPSGPAPEVACGTGAAPLPRRAEAGERERHRPHRRSRHRQGRAADAGRRGARAGTARSVPSPPAAEARTQCSGAFRPAPPPSRIAGMRRRIAEHMAHSVATAPHVTAVFEADFSPSWRIARKNKAGIRRAGRQPDPDGLFRAGLRGSHEGLAHGQQPLA